MAWGKSEISAVETRECLLVLLASTDCALVDLRAWLESLVFGRRIVQ